MRVRRIGAVFIAASLSTMGLIGAATLPAQAATCPDRGWTIKDNSVGFFFNTNGVNIRTGPGTNCTSVGQGQRSHDVTFDCYKPGDGGTWTHLFDNSTGREGWVKDTLLVDNGSHIRC
jgi:hypothetical protein